MFWNIMGVWAIMDLFVLLMIIKASEGYEDEEGFHRGKPSRLRRNLFSN